MNWASFRLAPLALAASFAAATDPGEQLARFELPDDPSQVVINYSVRIGEIDATDYAWLRIYADGRVVRHRPEYMKNSGDYVGEMTHDQLCQLLHSLADKGIMEFDSQAVRRSRREAERGQSTLFAKPDASLIRIEVQLASYQPIGDPNLHLPFQRTISWLGLRQDAKRFPGITEIQNLAAASSQLNELAEWLEDKAQR